jgi:drug/metabolite transporter (DMT)-like permease
MHARARTTVYGALVVQTLLAAGTYLLAKRTLLEIPALPLGLFRFTGASVLLSLLLLRLRPKGARLPPREAWPRLLVLAFVAVPINQGFFLVGLQRSTAAHAALLYTLTPLFVLLLAQALLRERPGFRTAFGTLLALGGTLFVLLEKGVGARPLFGDLLLTGAVLAWAVFTAEGRDLVARFGALPAIAWPLIAGTALFLPIGLASLWPAREALRHVSTAAWLGVVYLIVVTSVLSYLIWYWALAHLTAARVAVFSNLQPLATAVLAQLFLGEQVTIAFYCAALVVIGGVVLAQTSPDQRLRSLEK